MTTPHATLPPRVFITGGTGYLGSRLIKELLTRGYGVQALARSRDAAKRLPVECKIVVGNALDSKSFTEHVRPASTFVHLVGVSRPAPWKAREFRNVDMVSIRASIAAAQAADITHFVYVSVAQPAPAMKAYVQTRAECEGFIRTSGLHATILRPWYVIGPGHWWPLSLLPLYWLMKRFSATRDTALRLGLVTHKQMTSALLWAIEHPVQEIRIMDVPQIRRPRISGERLSK
ncbi:MAG: NAD-dependent epimerase/dehydratase family protein [Nitrospiraceae bacterium]